ncbi:metallophosphoesterase [Clostridium vincentii]|uniref:Putative metallophosphoesterase n=1 Tax=Clostridium vincentii TaxID=52704 RepID=A0A2T0BB31_9CLOT|nr:metallophosphoesterase [Clostridium vincentii]PRR81100.1 putative metallophosphoesterase [Clostridium vincentii]
MRKINGKYKKVLLNSSIFLIPFCYWQNNNLVVTNLKYSNKNIPKAFNNFKILQISDLHNKSFGDNQCYLVNHTKDIAPDIIVITGDLIDSTRTNIDIAIDYIKQIRSVASIYFVSGNHEESSGVYNELKKRLEELGVIILDDKQEFIEKDGETLTLLGLKDGTSFSDRIKTIKGNEDKFTILLAHKPEYFNIYSEENIDLVFSGHAHGGQFRMPFVGGLYSPGQGVFPKYTSGMYTKNNTSMVVSRGLGNSGFPLRLFNRPELIVVTLKSDS